MADILILFCLHSNISHTSLIQGKNPLNFELKKEVRRANLDANKGILLFYASCKTTIPLKEFLKSIKLYVTGS